MIVVSDSGPLLALAKIGYLRLVRSLYGDIHVSHTVQQAVNEVTCNHPEYNGHDELNWIQPVNANDTQAVHLLRERLTLSESESLLLVFELSADLLLIDEERGRRLADMHHLKKIGTIGTVVLAKQRDLISSVTPLLNALLASGFRMTGDIYNAAHKLAE